jgi:uncharacterized protein (UPF0332 family)
MSAFDPHDFLDLSIHLCSDSNYKNDSRLRTSIGRAYYATFLVVREYLTDNFKCGFNDDAQEHKNVIERITNIDPDIGEDLKKLRLDRNDADYHLNIHISSDNAKIAISRAQNIIFAFDHDIINEKIEY